MTGAQRRAEMQRLEKLLSDARQLMADARKIARQAATITELIADIAEGLLDDDGRPQLTVIHGDRT